MNNGFMDLPRYLFFQLALNPPPAAIEYTKKEATLDVLVTPVSLATKEANQPETSFFSLFLSDSRVFYNEDIEVVLMPNTYVSALPRFYHNELDTIKNIIMSSNSFLPCTVVWTFLHNWLFPLFSSLVLLLVLLALAAGSEMKFLFN